MSRGITFSGFVRPTTGDRGQDVMLCEINSSFKRGVTVRAIGDTAEQAWTRAAEKFFAACPLTPGAASPAPLPQQKDHP